MIPLKLHIAGFLSYRQPVELDFTVFDLACISGQNGAGKSSLLDAITWVLFGEARKKDESIINLQSKAAEVWLTFEYEGSRFRVQRTLPRNKTTLLEFQVLDGDEWRALSERTTRDTQKRIERVLRLDYDTFINASFLLQGQADQFTQQAPGRRKEVLGKILGLEVWETYRERTAALRKEIEARVDEFEGRIAEITAEVAQEAPRKARLKDLESRLAELTSARSTQENALESIRRTAAALAEQRRFAEALLANLQRSQAAAQGLEERLAQKTSEQAAYQELTARAPEVQAAWQGWIEARESLSRMDAAAASFRIHDEKRQPLLLEIETERARLAQECESLQSQAAEWKDQAAVMEDLGTRLEAARRLATEAEARLARRLVLEEEAAAALVKQAELKAENDRLRLEMNEIKERMEQLEASEGLNCPLCGQELTEAHRLETVKALKKDGKARGDAHRANTASLKEMTDRVNGLAALVQELAPAEQERLEAAGSVMQWSERLQAAQARAHEWEQGGAKRLEELTTLLESGGYAKEARKRLARLDKELAALGYDAAAHDEARLTESNARVAEEEYRRLETAREVSKQIAGEVKALEADIQTRRREAADLQGQYDTVAAALELAGREAPDPLQAEEELLRLREQENQKRDEVGAARQEVQVIGPLRERQKELESRREEAKHLIARHKMLERAFGRDGVPALLIEQALPEIENRANELLDRLSDGQMSIRFSTQEKYKDKKRTDLRETLDILISDGAGTRDYEMYSGGEAFRVNFAVRLALSEVLAQRKGARLQTLVIDEGFGSQDVRGRQRLVEAINLVRGDFAKILVITHLDELKDAFPTRIEVEKTEEGSTIQVMS